MFTINVNANVNVHVEIVEPKPDVAAQAKIDALAQKLKRSNNALAAVVAANQPKE